MTVGRIMTHNPFTIEPEASVIDARALMRREKVHRLPVVDRHKKLVGFVTEKDLMSASPSAATTLDVFEITSLLSRLTVDKLMKRKLHTVASDTLIEDAVRLMVDNDIGGLPVLDNDRLVGIVTESDIFRLFIDHFGTRQKGARVTAMVSEKPGTIAALTAAIAAAGGNIISLGTFPGDDPDVGICTVKITGVPCDRLREVMKPHVVRIVDIREV
jgi:acetoin utilization protein AcuB